MKKSIRATATAMHATLGLTSLHCDHDQISGDERNDYCPEDYA
jgi:hypothetical protein